MSKSRRGQDWSGALLLPAVGEMYRASLSLNVEPRRAVGLCPCKGWTSAVSRKGKAREVLALDLATAGHPPRRVPKQGQRLRRQNSEQLLSSLNAALYFVRRQLALTSS